MAGISNTLRRIVSKATVKLARYYTRRDRVFRYRQLRLKVLKDVFHPGLYRSSKTMAEWLETQPLSGLRILEIGCGSGLLSLVAAAKGAKVTAVDINATAVENTRMNAAANKLQINALQSDLFDSLPLAVEVDMVIANPPYYPKAPGNDLEQAWYCGEDFIYFRRLFDALRLRGLADKCYLVLSDTCDLDAIKTIAASKNIGLDPVSQKKISGEWLIIYRTKLRN
ncbi:MAG TPA: methyltransferase [Chitinophagaceae bacterium]